MRLNLNPEAARVRADVGRMTAGMRAAVAPSAPRALRIARLVGGRIVEERICIKRERVRGWLEGVRFDIERGSYVLCVSSGAAGHVFTGDARLAIGPLAARIVLDESARGKIVVDGQTILFQLVVAPPRSMKPKLPLAATRKPIDWPFTMVAAFSFLFHFGVVGATFSDWVDPVVGDDTAPAVKLLDTTSNQPAPSVEQASTPDSNGHASTPTTQTSNERAAGSRSEHTTAAGLARQAEEMGIGLLGAFKGGPAVEGAMRRSDVPLVDLDRVAREPSGVDATDHELVLSHGSAVTVPGPTRLDGLGSGHVIVSRTSHERVVDGPKADVLIPHIDPPPTAFGIEGPIAAMRPSFRACYVKKGLSLDPTMEGKLVIDIAIAPNGDASTVTKLEGRGLSSAVETCIMQRAQMASFPAQSGSGAHVRVPIVFRRQP